MGFIDLNCEEEDDLHQTVLYYAAREGKTKCIDYLVQNGCVVDRVDIYRQTPLYYAVRENRYEAAKKLIELLGMTREECIKKLNHVDSEGETCLFYAVGEGHLEMTKLLVESGIDINIENKEKLTALDVSQRK